MKNFLVAMVAMLLWGCASSAPKVAEGGLWREYFHNDASVRGIKFYAHNAQGLQTGVAVVKFNDTQRKLGDIYALDSNVTAITILDDKSLNLHDKSDISALKTAKNFEFYELRYQMLSSANFSADSGICTAWEAKEPIMARWTQNYYSFVGGTTAPFATFIEAQISKNGAHVRQMKFLTSLLSKEHSALALQNASMPEFKALIKADILKQARLFALICASQ